jgi:hypothetical protein
MLKNSVFRGLKGALNMPLFDITANSELFR